jgi:hypothetical protein
VHLRSHQIRRVSSCSSKNSYANNVRCFLLQISPIFRFLYLAVCSEATQNVDLLKLTLRSMLQNHVFSYILLLQLLITPSIFYFIAWLGGIELKVKSWYNRRYLRLRRGPTLRVTTTSALSWHRARAAALVMRPGRGPGTQAVTIWSLQAYARSLQARRPPLRAEGSHGECCCRRAPVVCLTAHTRPTKSATR